MKPEVRIQGWVIFSEPYLHLRGMVKDHPKLGTCGDDEFCKTSQIESISFHNGIAETLNTIYQLSYLYDGAQNRKKYSKPAAEL